ncbi:MAG TPA: type I-U CRISPR-associated protein Csx17, partial [Polyangiaceae bacterium]|nr:type I-U CRISPR-associated protein Csx17 [Polyangiaceae bacterium]
PWNKGSGFYEGNYPALGALERSTAPRFAQYRAGISAARKPLAEITRADAEVRRLKDRTKKKKGMSRADAEHAAALRLDPDFKAQLAAAEREFKRLKADLYAPFALTWRGSHRDWMDAAMVLADKGAPTWAWMLGTGGNDGRLDFTYNAMQRLVELFELESPAGAASPSAVVLLANALWGEATNEMKNAAVGQFLPGTAGGANGTTGPDSPAQVNPWDFILMLEGSVMFRGQATRRLDTRATGRAAIPFAVHAHAVGHGTRGREATERGEQWMPLWNRPSTAGDVSALLGEGRAQLNRAIAQRPLDFARAVAKLGVARGLSGFARYGFLERNGQSKIAVPLGRIAVRARVHAHLIDDLGAWLDLLQRQVRDGDAPARLAIAEGALADAVFTVLTAQDDARHWQTVLIAAARVEAVQASGTGFEAGPTPRLSSGWLEAACDDSPEWRLAIALGSAAAGYARRSGLPFDTVRAHALPLAGSRYAMTAEKRLAKDPRVVMTGREPVSDFAALVERRIIEATQRGERMLPLVAQHRRGARLTDIAKFLDGAVDDERVIWLARGLMALEWGPKTVPSSPPARDWADIDEAWMALRLCASPSLKRDGHVAIDAAMIRRLISGDAQGAVSIALKRLSAAGYRPPLRSATTDRVTAWRWAAALAFPLDRVATVALASRFQNHADRIKNQTENA